MFRRLLTFATNRIYNLPVVVLMPHSRCNCRCVMCDIWKANANKREISAEELEKHIHHFKNLGVREVVFSGGEALMHSNLWKLCSLLHGAKIKVTLLSTGLLLERNAEYILKHIDEIIISIDGSRPVHDAIRNIPNGFEKITAGVSVLKRMKPSLRITGRSVLQRHNFKDYIATVIAAKEMGLDQISFLAADISTTAFNHENKMSDERISDIALNKDEVHELEVLLERSFVELNGDYDRKFIAESPAKMKKIVQYYKAVNGLCEFPDTVCNAPWVSAVIESDGNVMPCFFHRPYGNIYQQDFLDIINSDAAIEFRRKLNVSTDEVCKKCVCSLKVGVREMT